LVWYFGLENSDERKLGNKVKERRKELKNRLERFVRMKN